MNRATAGVMLSILGTLFTAVGYTLQKLAHRRAAASAVAAEVDAARKGGATTPQPRLPLPKPNVFGAATAPSLEDSRAEQIPLEEPKALPFWRFWQAGTGLLCLVAGSCVSVAALSLAGQASLAPVAVLTLVWQELLSWRVLGESLGAVDFVAVALMVSGTAVAIIFANHADPELTLADIVTAFGSPRALAYTAVAMTAATAVAVLLRACARTPASALSRAAYAGDAAGRAALGGLFAGWTGVLVKALTSTLMASLAAGSAANWRTAWPWLFLAGLAASLSLQLAYLNSALARHAASRVVPVYQVTLVFANIVAGVVYWDELIGNGGGATTSAVFFTGVAIALAGVVVLAVFKRREAAAAAAASAVSTACAAAPDLELTIGRSPVSADSGGVAAAAAGSHGAAAAPVVHLLSKEIRTTPRPAARVSTGHRVSASDIGAGRGGGGGGSSSSSSSVWARRSRFIISSIVERDGNADTAGCAGDDDEDEEGSDSDLAAPRGSTSHRRRLLPSPPRRPASAPASRRGPQTTMC